MLNRLQVVQFECPRHRKPTISSSSAMSQGLLAMRKMSFAHPRRVEWIRRVREVVERADSDTAVGKKLHSWHMTYILHLAKSSKKGMHNRS